MLNRSHSLGRRDVRQPILFCGVLSIACALSASAEPVPVVVAGESAPTSLEAQWERVSRLVEISIDDFAQVRADHRSMLANMSDAIVAIEGAGDEPQVPSVCFSPGVSWQTVGLFNAFAQRGQKFQGTDAGRWSTTTVDGGGLQQGDTITLRVSFPPDGVSLVDFTNTGFGEPDTPNNLNASFDAGFGSTATWKALFQSVFDDWSDRAGVSYVFDFQDDGAAFPTSPGSNTRGDIRITGHTIDGPGAGILAYNYGPNTGDMVIDTGNTTDSFAASTANNYRFLRNTVSHEHGHGLGFAHVCPLNSAIVMEPIITTAFDHSAEDDIRHANRKYGDPRERGGRNDTSSTATTLGVLNVGMGDAGDFLSIDSINDDDYFEVTTTAPRVVDFTLTPTGTLYQEGAQNTPSPSDTSGCNASVTSFTNGQAVINLGLEILASNGTTVLASSTSNAIGVAEAVNNLFMPANGTFYIRVFTNDGPNANTNTQVQLYTLDVNSEAAAAGTLSIGSQASSVEENDAITLTATATDFTPATFVWRRNGTPLSTVTGNELRIDPVTLADAGRYTVEADSGSKALIVSPPFILSVVPVGSLPAAGLVGILALSTSLAGSGIALVRRRRA